MNVSNHQPIDNLLKINPISLNSISIILKALIEDVQQRTGGALDETTRGELQKIVEGGSIEEFLHIFTHHLDTTGRDTFLSSPVYADAYFVFSQLLKAGKISQKDIASVHVQLGFSENFPVPKAKRTNVETLELNIALDLDCETLNDRADQLCNKAEILMTLGKVDEAIEYFTQCIENENVRYYHVSSFGYNLMKVGKFSQSVEVLEWGVDVFPESLDIQRYLSICYHKLGRFDESTEIMENIIKEHPQDENAYISYCGMLHERGEYVISQEVAKKGILHIPNCVFFHGLLGFSLNGQKRYKETIEALLPIMSPENEAQDEYFYYVHAQLFQAYYQLGDISLAEHHLQEALRVGPKGNEILLGEFISLMMQQEKKDELLIFLQRQLVIEPHFPFLHSQIAVLLHTLESQDTKQIEHHLSTAITLAHRANNAQATAGFYIHYGAFYASRGNFANALRELNRALTLTPDNAEIYFQMASSYIELGNAGKSQAEKCLKKALQLAPDNLDYLMSYGGFLNQYQGNPLKAVEIFKTVLTVQPDYALGYNQYGIALGFCSEFPLANENLLKAIELEPLNGLFYAQYAEFLELALEKGKIEEIPGVKKGKGLSVIKKYFEKAVKLEGNNHIIRFMIGQFFIAHTQFKAAYLHLKKAVKIAPDTIQYMEVLALACFGANKSREGYSWVEKVKTLRPESEEED